MKSTPAERRVDQLVCLDRGRGPGTSPTRFGALRPSTTSGRVEAGRRSRRSCRSPGQTVVLARPPGGAEGKTKVPPFGRFGRRKAANRPGRRGRLRWTRADRTGTCSLTGPKPDHSRSRARFGESACSAVDQPGLGGPATRACGSRGRRLVRRRPGRRPAPWCLYWAASDRRRRGGHLGRTAGPCGAALPGRRAGQAAAAGWPGAWPLVAAASGPSGGPEHAGLLRPSLAARPADERRRRSPRWRSPRNIVFLRRGLHDEETRRGDDHKQRPGHQCGTR